MTLGSTLPDQMLRHWSAVAIIISSIQNGGGRWTSTKQEEQVGEKYFDWSHWKRGEYKVTETCR